MRVQIFLALFLIGYLSAHLAPATPTCMLRTGYYAIKGRRRLQAVADYCPVRPAGFQQCDVTGVMMQSLHDNWKVDRLNIHKYLEATPRMMKLLTEMQQGYHLRPDWQNRTGCKGKSVHGLIGKGRDRRLQKVKAKCTAAQFLKDAVEWQKKNHILELSQANADRCDYALKKYKAGFVCSASNWMTLAMSNIRTKTAYVCSEEQNELWGKECEGWIYDMASLNYLLNGWDKVYWGKHDDKTLEFVPYFNDIKQCGKDIGEEKDDHEEGVVRTPEVIRYKSCKNVANALNFQTLAGPITYGMKYFSYFQHLVKQLGDEHANTEVNHAFSGVVADRDGFPKVDSPIRSRRLQTPIPPYWNVVLQTDYKGQCINTKLFQPKDVRNLL